MKSTKLYVSLRVAIFILMLLLLIPYSMHKITFSTWQVSAYILLAGNFALIALRHYKNPVQGAKFAVFFNSLAAVILLIAAFYWAVFVR